ncbi:hypothetical protein D1632_10795 [Chryseobacterium nematophagum]|uniref:Uncharacterized protein n=1 Tax=Chryseobacterium nematophagum TaxID=2305228 RepID=A0A3M7LBC7_9FLAO|nr:hypothetical protein [Chryseobacterium nematophagum]RMZ60068.1 hypothetical protein D1632_10795 [Chryseobacterium nematophagum]
MKKVILALLLSTSNLLFSQFTVTDSSDNWNLVGKTPWGGLELYINKNRAKLSYLDANTPIDNLFSPPAYYSFEFSIDNETIEKIYHIIEEHFKSQKKETLTLTFPEGNMYLLFDTAIGSYFFAFQFDNLSGDYDKNSEMKRQTPAFKMRQINKLFGKKN